MTEPAPPGDAHSVFLVWEGLRVPYNVVLGAVTLLFGIGNYSDTYFWAMVFRGAVLANICLCVGPCAEGYLALLGIPRRPARLALFTIGTCLAVVLAAGCAASFGFSND